MSQNLLSESEWKPIYNRLCTAFNTYSANQSSQAALYFSVLSKYSHPIVEEAVNVAIRTHEKFPAIALLLMIIKELETPKNPAIDEAKAERQRQYHIDQQSRHILEKIDKLSQQERASIYKTAEQFVPENIQEWLPMKTRNFLVDMKAILLYKERHMGTTQPFDCLADFEKTGQEPI